MKQSPFFRLVAASTLCVLCVAASTPTLAGTPQGPVVTIRNFMFSPMSTTIRAGTTVTWKNLDAEPHSVVNDAGMFHSPALDQNDTYRYTFAKPGVYRIFCGIHPFMKATITVR